MTPEVYRDTEGRLWTRHGHFYLSYDGISWTDWEVELMFGPMARVHPPPVLQEEP